MDFGSPQKFMTSKQEPHNHIQEYMDEGTRATLSARTHQPDRKLKSSRNMIFQLLRSTSHVPTVSLNPKYLKSLNI